MNYAVEYVFHRRSVRERRTLQWADEYLAIEDMEEELASDYERQRWRDFVNLYYCDDYENVLRRLIRDYRNSDCIHGRLTNKNNEPIKPTKMKKLMVYLYHQEDPSLCETACRLVDTLDLLRRDLQKPRLLSRWPLADEED